MIDFAIIWIETHANLLEQMEIDIVEQVSTPDDLPVPSYRVDFTRLDYLARFTLWETGLCDIEVINIMTENTTYWKHCELVNIIDVDSAFGLLLNKLHG